MCNLKKRESAINRVRSGSKSSSTSSDKTDSQFEKTTPKTSNSSENGENERVPPKRQSTFSRLRSRISRASSKSPVKSDDSKSNGVMKASNLPDKITGSIPEEPKDKTHLKEKRKSFFN